MNDKELADAIVALGVADEKHPPQSYRLGNKYQLGYFGWVSAHRLVREWRVAGALMEKCQKVFVEYIGDKEQTVYARSESNRTWDWHFGESLPRTIIGACVEVLTADRASLTTSEDL